MDERIKRARDLLSKDCMEAAGELTKLHLITGAPTVASKCDMSTFPYGGTREEKGEWLSHQPCLMLHGKAVTPREFFETMQVVALHGVRPETYRRLMSES